MPARRRRDVRVTLDVFSPFGKQASDIDYHYHYHYHYPSRLQGEPAAGFGDIHFHPVEPRRRRLTPTANF